jgi:hypothetical protein
MKYTARLLAGIKTPNYSMKPKHYHAESQRNTKDR